MAAHNKAFFSKQRLFQCHVTNMSGLFMSIMCMFSVIGLSNASLFQSSFLIPLFKESLFLLLINKLLAPTHPQAHSCFDPTTVQDNQLIFQLILKLKHFHYYLRSSRK